MTSPSDKLDMRGKKSGPINYVKADDVLLSQNPTLWAVLNRVDQILYGDPWQKDVTLGEMEMEGLIMLRSALPTMNHHVVKGILCMLNGMFNLGDQHGRMSRFDGR